jgi:hypothetical protein
VGVNGSVVTITGSGFGASQSNSTLRFNQLWQQSTVGATRRSPLPLRPACRLGQYDCVLIVTDHSDYNYRQIVSEAKLVVDTRNATRGIKSEKIVHC